MIKSESEKGSIAMDGKQYIEERESGGLYITGTRISLDSIVYAFNSGESAESIMRSYPPLSLEQIYGAITYYLANRIDVDEYLAQEREEYKKFTDEGRLANPKLYKLLDSVKQPQ